jgi:predicted DCC family thiol-disulfide oxidoreductase YuxK
VLALPNQTPGVIRRHGLSRSQVDAGAWTVEPDGRRLGGAAAVNRVLRELGGGWALVSRAYGLAPVGWLEEMGYRWVVRNRHRLSRWGDPPACEQAGVDCQ